MSMNNAIDNASSQLQVATNFNISSSSVMTNTSQPAFMAFMTNTVANVTGDATQYDVVFDTVSFDNGSNYNVSTGVFTAPVVGKYLFVASVFADNLNTVSGRYNVFLRGTFGDVYWSTMKAPNLASSMDNEAAYGGSYIATMAAGNVAHIVILAASGPKDVGVLGRPGTFFGGYLIG